MGAVVVGGVVVGGGEGALVVGAAPVVGTDSGGASPFLSFPAQASDPTKINGTTDIVIALRNPDCTMPLTAASRGHIAGVASSGAGLGTFGAPAGRTVDGSEALAPNFCQTLKELSETDDDSCLGVCAMFVMTSASGVLSRMASRTCGRFQRVPGTVDRCALIVMKIAAMELAANASQRPRWGADSQFLGRDAGIRTRDLSVPNAAR